MTQLLPYLEGNLEAERRILHAVILGIFFPLTSKYRPKWQSPDGLYRGVSQHLGHISLQNSAVFRISPRKQTDPTFKPLNLTYAFRCHTSRNEYMHTHMHVRVHAHTYMYAYTRVHGLPDMLQAVQTLQHILHTPPWGVGGFRV